MIGAFIFIGIMFLVLAYFVGGLTFDGISNLMELRMKYKQEMRIKKMELKFKKLEIKHKELNDIY